MYECKSKISKLTSKFDFQTFKELNLERECVKKNWGFPDVMNFSIKISSVECVKKN